MLRIGYTVLLWLKRNELRIAKRTGRNAASITKLNEEILEYELLLFKQVTPLIPESPIVVTLNYGAGDVLSYHELLRLANDIAVWMVDFKIAHTNYGAREDLLEWKRRALLAETKLAEMTDRYECNTAIMPARTELLAQVQAKLAEAERRNRAALEAMKAADAENSILSDQTVEDMKAAIAEMEKTL